MNALAQQLQAQGLPVKPVPTDPEAVFLLSAKDSLTVRNAGFFYRMESLWPDCSGSAKELLQAPEGLPYVKLLASRGGVKLRAEVAAPERVREVLEAVPSLYARLQGQEVPLPDGKFGDPRELELFLKSLASARGGQLQRPEDGWLLLRAAAYPLRVTLAPPGVRVRLDFWAFQPDRPPAWDEWLLALQPHLRFIKATREGLGCDLPGGGLTAEELGLAVDGLRAAAQRFGPAARALQEPLVAQIFHQLTERETSFQKGGNP